MGTAALRHIFASSMLLLPTLLLFVASAASFLLVYCVSFSLRQSATTEDSISNSFLQLQRSDNGSIISRRLRHYQMEDVVQCFDHLQNRRRRNKDRRPYHIAFIGESIPRFQFASFIESIPDYDHVITMEQNDGVLIKLPKHMDRNVSSQLLNLIVSFRWRPLIDDKFIESLRQWNTPPYSSTPDLIVMGAGLHHMKEENGNDYETFAQRLKEQLKPIVRQLINVSSAAVVWIQQTPIIAGLVHHNGDDTFAAAKIQHYNAGVRHILNNNGSADTFIFWDSAEPVAIEYHRSCAIYQRFDYYFWRKCNDDIHLGYVALENSNHILLNYLCHQQK